MLTNNLPESHQQSQDDVLNGKADVKDKTELSKFEKWSEIIIPAGGVIATLIAAAIGGAFVWFQVQEGNKKSELDGAEAQIARNLDKASQASKARQEVLTDYAKSMTALVTQRGLDDKPSKEPVDKKQVENLATAATLVALDRLDDGRNTLKSEYLLLEDNMREQVNKLDTDVKKTEENDNNLQYFKGFNTEGSSKGSLIRFLYGSKLVNGDETRVVKLRGANLTGVDLNYTDLPGINLQRAWLTWGTLRGAILQQADLRGADLRGANLQQANLQQANLGWAIVQQADLRGADLIGAIVQQADLRGADLRGADLIGATLSATELKGACYDTDTKFDRGIDLASLAMRKIANPAPDDFICQE